MLKTGTHNSNPSLPFIKFNKLFRFLKVGLFLHVMAIIGVVLTFLAFQFASYYLLLENNFWAIVFSILMILCSTMPIFAELDALGRYQNYKQIKDVLFKMKYDDRLLKPFMHSKCQRDAVIVAAQDLKVEKKVKKFFFEKEYRFYHILPDAFMVNPLILFKRQFWIKILFAKHYELENFYW